MISERLHLQQRWPEKLKFCILSLIRVCKVKRETQPSRYFYIVFTKKKNPFRQMYIHSTYHIPYSITLHLLPPSKNLPNPI